MERDGSEVGKDIERGGGKGKGTWKWKGGGWEGMRE